MRISFLFASAPVFALVACAPEVATLEVTPESAVITEAEQEVVLLAAAKTAEGEEVAAPQIAWSSSDETVATVDATGKVKGLSSGTATLTAKVGEVTDTTAVRVSLLKSLSLTPGAVVATVAAEPVKLTVVGADEKGGVVDVAALPAAWSTKDAAIATVGADGTVTGVAAGSTTVVVKLGELSAEAPVTVNPAAEVAPVVEGEAAEGAAGEAAAVDVE